ncbi:hypothetical protein [Solimicrobium silvestre]|uniref:Uncharacterized protein n=1 Tax=Solimicrobium silvestre TaxID=2099400 RepID=A0A2S9H1M7_9BURK|nr:hypothetical protein [Solimicrobium silvestre]PRC93891.1 hypothetical protein S2091_1500 [Solimicrobium silvestre]
MDLRKIKNDYKLLFSSELNFFRDPRYGLILGVPMGLEDNSSQDFFQICEPHENTYFTASMYHVNGMTLSGWAKIRYSTVEQKMPYLEMVCEPYQVNGANWIGFAAEYEGTFPGNDYVSRYLVLCFCQGVNLISFTITARRDKFEENVELYNWIIKNALILEVLGTK